MPSKRKQGFSAEQVPVSAYGASFKNLKDLEREFFIADLLVQIHYIIEMIKWTGLAPW